MSNQQASGTQPPQESSKDTGFIPGEDAWTQCRNVFAILTGKMTDAGKEQFRLAKDIRNEAVDCKRCEDQRDFLLKYSEFAVTTEPSLFFKANCVLERSGCHFLGTKYQ